MNKLIKYHVVLKPCLFICLYITSFHHVLAFNIREKFEASDSLFQAGQYQHSIDSLKSILGNSEYFTEKYPRERILNFMGINYEHLGQYQDALRYYTEAIKHIKGLEKPSQFLPYVYINVGNLYSNQGDYDLATEYYNKALNTIKEGDENYGYLKNLIYHNLGDLYYNTGFNNKAKDFFLMAIEVEKEFKLPTFWNTYNGLAATYDNIGELEYASEYFILSINGYLEEYGEDLTLARFCRDYGKFLIKQDYYQQGLTYYEKTNEIYHKYLGPKHPIFSYSYNNYGEYCNKIKDYKRALEYFQKALIAKIPEFNDSSFFSNPGEDILVHDIQLLDILKNKAAALHYFGVENNNRQALDKCLETYKLCTGAIDFLKTSYVSFESKQFLAENEKNTYLQALDEAYFLFEHMGDRKYLNEIFYYAEKAKSTVLASSVRENEALLAGGIPSDLLLKEKELKERLTAVADLLNEERKTGNDTLKIKNLEGNVFNLKHAYNNLKKQLEQDYPDYFAVKYDNNVVDVASIQSGLLPGQVLLEYTLHGPFLYTCMVTPGQFDVKKSPVDSIFYHDIARLKNMAPGQGGVPGKFRESAERLYNTLIKPFENQAEGKHLLVVAGEQLEGLKFEALLAVRLGLNAASRVSYVASATSLFRNSLKPVLERQQARLALKELELTKQRGQKALLLAGLLLAVLFSFMVYYRARQRSLEQKQKALLAEQKLLRSQLDPHFIFNTLGTIQNFSFDNKPLEMSSYIAKFAKMVRAILKNTLHEYIPFNEELEFIRNYLDLQKLRFEDRFDYQIETHVGNPGKIKIPPMLSQPFVENAIKHGILPGSEKGMIHIRYTLNGGSLHLEIEDNGIGIEQSSRKKGVKWTGFSISTQVTRERLKLLGKKHEKHEITITDLSDIAPGHTGTRVLLDMPVKVEG